MYCFVLYLEKPIKIGLAPMGHKARMQDVTIPAKFHDFSMMLTNLKDSHDLTIVFGKKNITHEFEE